VSHVGWWRVYTASGVFTSEDGSPWDAPRQDVQIIVQEDDAAGWRIVHSKDYYYFEEERGGWNGGDTFAMFDHMLRAKSPCLLFGRMLSDEDWKALFSRVKTDVGERTGRANREPLREPYT